MTETTTPQVGDGATIAGWSDRIACTITYVSKSGKMIYLQEDTSTLLNGVKSGESDALDSTPGGFGRHVDGVQRYSYERNPKGSVSKATLRTLRDGSTCWKQVGSTTRSPGGWISVKGRSHHYDYNF